MTLKKLCLILFLVLAASPCKAQVYDLTAAHQLPANLEGGGEFSQTRTRAQTSGKLFKTPSLFANWSLSLGSAHYDFAHGATAPWSDIYYSEVNVSFIRPINRRWSLMISPGVSAAGEADAEAGKSLSYGLVSALNWQASETLRLGIGGGVFDNLEDLQAFPFIMVDWQFVKGWRLANPLRAGVTGPAGLELSWQPDEDWTLGAGSAWRTFRFRLDGDAPQRDGIVEEQMVPVWMRVTRNLPAGLLTLYLGVSFEGELTMENRHGDRVSKQSYDEAPFGALYFSGSF